MNESFANNTSLPDGRSGLFQNAQITSPPLCTTEKLTMRIPGWRESFACAGHAKQLLRLRHAPSLVEERKRKGGKTPVLTPIYRRGRCHPTNGNTPVWHSAICGKEGDNLSHVHERVEVTCSVKVLNEYNSFTVVSCTCVECAYVYGTNLETCHLKALTENK